MTIKETEAAMRQNFLCAFEAVARNHPELGVELGILKEITDPETGETYYYVGLPVDDFSEFIIQSVLSASTCLEVHQIHHHLMKDDPIYV